MAATDLTAETKTAAVTTESISQLNLKQQLLRLRQAAVMTAETEAAAIIAEPEIATITAEAEAATVTA
jgi:hypothetical protein